MCQIVIYRPENQLKNFLEQMKRAENANRDGNGFAQEGKAYYNVTAQEAYNILNPLKPAIFHARIATSGKSLNMLHPFKIKGGFLFHNGVMNGRFKGDAIFSDTAHLAEFLKQADISAYDMAKSTPIINNMFPELEGNRLAVLTNRGTIATFGEGWQKVNGIQCCGTGCQPATNYGSYGLQKTPSQKTQTPKKAYSTIWED